MFGIGGGEVKERGKDRENLKGEKKKKRTFSFSLYGKKVSVIQRKEDRRPPELPVDGDKKGSAPRGRLPF